jgi:diphosphomevalonate decarboxylase
MKATAIAPANIAFIKYWGKVDPVLRVPQNNSISMNLSEMYTTTTVEFLPDYEKDIITFLNEDVVSDKELGRIVWALDKIRILTKTKLFAKVVTQNTFPKATGIASSASGFASLAKAAFGALMYQINEKDLSKFCRQLSGTACRSIPDGIVEWQKGIDSNDSYAYKLYNPDYFDICDVIAVVSKTAKKVGSTEGHALAPTSPFYLERMKGMEQKIILIKKALAEKDFLKYGEIIENEALNMHAICLTSIPPLIYWEPATITIMKKIIAWREKKIVNCYFTIDAGPSVHVICESKDAKQLQNLLKQINGVQSAVINKPTIGAHLVEKHLF